MHFRFATTAAVELAAHSGLNQINWSPEEKSLGQSLFFALPKGLTHWSKSIGTG